VKLRRTRFGFRSAMLDIVSTSRKMSTKPDQAQTQADARGGSATRGVQSNETVRLRRSEGRSATAGVAGSDVEDSGVAARRFAHPPRQHVYPRRDNARKTRCAPADGRHVA
jgi:hypothetical protein